MRKHINLRGATEFLCEEKNRKDEFSKDVHELFLSCTKISSACATPLAQQGELLVSFLLII